MELSLKKMLSAAAAGIIIFSIWWTFATLATIDDDPKIQAYAAARDTAVQDAGPERCQELLEAGKLRAMQRAMAAGHTLDVAESYETSLRTACAYRFGFDVGPEHLAEYQRRPGRNNPDRPASK